MARNNGDTKDTLLEELESIRGLLQEPEDDIPILHEVIESIEPVDQEAPRQTSLFTTRTEPHRTTSARPRTTPTKASGENPFLPAHIRARLHGNRPPPQFDDGEAPTSAQAETPASTAPAAYTEREQLLEELICELQPHLEALLRDKLERLSQEALRHLRDDTPD